MRSTPPHLASAKLHAFLREASLAELGASSLEVLCRHSPGRLGITMGSEPNAGARVCEIEKNSRAHHAGLLVGDRITRVNGTIADGAIEAKRLIQAAARRKEDILLDVVRARPVERVHTVSMLESRLSYGLLGGYTCGSRPTLRRTSRRPVAPSAEDAVAAMGPIL